MQTMQANLRVDLRDVEDTPGVRTASVMFDHGLWFEAVVRGLIVELDLDEDEAFRAATAAARARLREPTQGNVRFGCAG
jgi:hypothetical protein